MAFVSHTTRITGGTLLLCGILCLCLTCQAADTTTLTPTEEAASRSGTETRQREVTAGWEITRKPLLRGFFNLYNACVLRVPDATYPFRMWLFGWAAEEGNPGYPGYDAIYCARGKDLAHWEVYAGDAGWDGSMTPSLWVPVVTASDAPYDNFHNGDPAVVLHDGVYHMAFSAVGIAPVTDAVGNQRLHLVSCVMAATSTDGLHWKKSEKPIALWSKEYADPWYLVDGKVGDPPPGHMGSYHRPALMYDSGRWRLWFDYYLPGTFLSLGVMENTAEFLRPEAWRLLRADQAPLLRNWPNACVVRAGKWLYSFSDAPYYPPEVGGEGRMLTMARSGDGLDWEVLGYLRPEPEACSHVPEALVLDGWLYVFYAYKPIVQPWDYRYKEIRMMRHRLADDGALAK